MDFQETEVTRPAFEGIFKRSIVNDNMNEEWYSHVYHALRVMYSYAILIIFLVGVIVCVFAIFLLRQSLVEKGYSSILSTYFPALLNSI